MRVLPHHQNTGGFFIAVLKKLPTSDNLIKPEPVNELNIEPTADTVTTSDSNTDDSNPPDPTGRGMKAAPAKRLKHVYDENPFRFCVDENQLQGWSKIEYVCNTIFFLFKLKFNFFSREFFGIKKEFPLEQLMMVIYFEC